MIHEPTCATTSLSSFCNVVSLALGGAALLGTQPCHEIPNKDVASIQTSAAQPVVILSLQVSIIMYNSTVSMLGTGAEQQDSSSKNEVCIAYVGNNHYDALVDGGSTVMPEVCPSLCPDPSDTCSPTLSNGISERPTPLRACLLPQLRFHISDHRRNWNPCRSASFFCYP